MTSRDKSKMAPPAAPDKGSASAARRKGALQIREVDAQALLHELRVHQFELEMQNEELRRARRETELALQRYTEIFDFSSIGYATLQGDNVIEDVNLAAAHILERRRSVRTVTPSERLVACPDRPALEAVIGAARSSGEKKACQLRLL